MIRELVSSNSAGGDMFYQMVLNRKNIGPQARIGDGAGADYFGAEVDELSLQGSIIGMDMTVVLKDDIALAPNLFYLLVRIRHAMQQTQYAKMSGENPWLS
jgi:hypothetical protein